MMHHISNKPHFKLIFLCLLCFPILLSSCWLIGDNNGFPEKIKFGKNGGFKVVSGKEPIYAPYIESGDNMVYETPLTPEDSAIYRAVASYQWLTIKVPYEGGCTDIEVYAEPNETGNRRTLNIEGMVADNGFSIKVIQGSK